MKQDVIFVHHLEGGLIIYFFAYYIIALVMMFLSRLLRESILLFAYKKL